MARAVTYVADIGQDIDDMVAAYALWGLGLLRAVIPDPPIGADAIGAGKAKRRIGRMVADGLPVTDAILDGTDAVFVGGALTKVAEFIDGGGRIGHLVVNGGFAGEGVVSFGRALPKFRGRRTVRTYNFDLDARATNRVLASMPDEVGHIMLVGKNVCHDPLNTQEGIWRGSEGFLGAFALRPGKRLHDLLMAVEGLAWLGLADGSPSCDYEMLFPLCDGLRGEMTRWGSSAEPTGYRRARVAVGWASTEPRRELTGLEGPAGIAEA